MKNNKLLEYKNLFICPICSTGLEAAEGKSLICRNNHCYDIAKQGYVNFYSSKDITYSEELFSHRHNIFEAGFYVPLVERIDEIIKRYAAREDFVILDAGCGEGYYIKSICRDVQCRKLAFDISKEAVRMAARGITDIAWMAADSGNIPVIDGGVDILLDILAPANYTEFNRVLSKDGIIVKAVPGGSYLKQLRRMAEGQLRNKEYDNADIITHFKQSTDYIDMERITYTMPVEYQQAASFAKMTPLLSNVDIDSLPLESLSEITIELEILIAKRKAAYNFI